MTDFFTLGVRNRLPGLTAGIIKRIIIGWAVLFLLGGVAARTTAASAVSADHYTVLVPERAHVMVNREIVGDLERNHYRSQEIDDQLSSRLLDRYLADLDRNRLYFLVDDIREFEIYRDRFDDFLLTNQLLPAYKIYNRFQQRVAERLLFVLDSLDQGLDRIRFDLDETMAIDRENAPWAATTAELDELWRKRLKGNLLSQKLKGKTIEEAAEIVRRRYRNQLNQLLQARSEDAFQTYINALAQLYDPHTSYMSPRGSENFDISMSLSFEGIGAVLQTEDEYVKIVRLIAGGPADKTGKLSPGDRIVGVGQGDAGELVDVVGWRIDDVVQLIRGPKGTMVRLQIIPAVAEDEHVTRTVRIIRNRVKLEEQAARKKILDVVRNGKTYKIGVIDIPTFYVDFKAMRAHARNYKSTTTDVKRLLKELIEARVDGVVIDLRDNSGGSLQEANSLTGLFIDHGPTVQIKSAGGRVEVLKDPERGIVYQGPLAVLVNRMSASASEIFAGAIQDYRRGLIIGEQTFGKGTVQTLLALSHGHLKTTSAKFYRISGESTQHKGVAPDILYPSMYDKEKLGESSLDEALPWDIIQPRRHQSYFFFAPYLKQLQARHRARLKIDPDYGYLLNRIAAQKTLRSRKEVSLNETVRRRERKEAEERLLAAENKRRRAKGMELLDSIDSLEQEKPADHVLTNEIPDDDPVLLESGRVLLDYIELSSQRLVNHGS